MVDDRIIIHKSLRYAALNALHFGHLGINKMCNDAAIFWWPNMRADKGRRLQRTLSVQYPELSQGNHRPSSNVKEDDRP